MDTAKRQVSFLESFPPDIWAYLAWYLPGEQLGRLMMTGATLLWQRLKSHTTVRSISLGKDFIVFKSFPAYLRELPSLEELMIYSRNPDWSDALGMKIYLLPSGLRKLELTGFWKKSLFGEPGRTLKLSQHLPHLETINLRSIKASDLSWMPHSPQSLTKLSLRLWKGDVELPPSLRHFDTYAVELSTETFVSKLPPSLESFVVELNFFGVDLVVPLLPPSTIKISLGEHLKYSCRSQTPQKLLEQLPKSLTCLTWLNFPHSNQQVVLLSSTLTELNIHTDLPCSVWPLLPRQLRTLSILAPEEMCTTNSTLSGNDGALQNEARSVPFDSFPRSITSLHMVPSSIGCLHFCGHPSVSNQFSFPPHLTYLSMISIQLSPEMAKLLPSSLTHLKVRNLCERVCKHLPNSIKTLISFKTLMSPNLIKFLPKSLTYLHLSPAGPQAPWLDCKTGKTIHFVSKHPEYIIHEKCTSNSFDWKEYSPLPPSLTLFHVDNENELGDSFLKYQRLPNLLELDLCYSKHFTDLSFPLLSSHLTTLNLASSSKVSGKSFPFLPRSLTSIDLTKSESIFDSDVQYLPRTLEAACLLNAIHLTDLCIPYLPPHLEILDLRGNAHITPSSVPRLPYPLRSSRRSARGQFAKWNILAGVIRQYYAQSD